MLRLKKDGSLPRFFLDEFLETSLELIDQIELGDKPNLGVFLDVATTNKGVQGILKTIKNESEQTSLLMTLYGLAWTWKTGRIIICDTGIQDPQWREEKASDLFQENCVMLLNTPQELSMANGAHVESVILVSSPYERVPITNPLRASDNWMLAENNKRTVLSLSIGNIDETLCVNYQFYEASRFSVGQEIDTYIQSVKKRYQPMIVQANLQDRNKEAEQMESMINSIEFNQSSFMWASEMMSAKKNGLVVETKQGKRVGGKHPNPKKKNKSHVKMYFKWDAVC